MTPKKMKTRQVPQSHYRTYLKKAGEFLDAMNAALNSGGWDAAGLNAAHCAISATDALLVQRAGLRSAGESHAEAVELFERYWGSEQDGKAGSLRKILACKHLAAYEDREMIESEAREVAKITQRFFEWAQSRLA